MNEIAKIECEIATLIARIKSSTLYACADVKEPFDRPTAMIPCAYAFFEVLVDSGIATGREHEWNQFLTETLAEVIRKSEEKWFN